MNLVTESYLKRYLKRKLSLKVVAQQQSKRKIRRRKDVPKVPPLRELRGIRIGYLITNLVQKMKVRLHLKSPLRKRGVERFKLKTENYFPDREFGTHLA